MIRLSVLVAVVLISAALNAHAAPEFCSPLPITVYVGNKSTDSQCNYDNIQAAISAAVCPETIVVTDEIVYPPQHLIISDKALTLTGSTASCGGPINQSRSVSDTLTPRIILSGNDDVDQAVITITGASHVTLNNFSISGARDTFYTSSDGGGIVFLNHGSLRLNNVELWQNYAAHGGGIAMLANGGHADLVIGAHTVIHDNVAQQNGGGIYMSGDVHLTMVSDQSAVYHNLARGELEDGTASGQGYGGGIYILGGRADIGSPGLSNGITGMPQNAVIADNDAVTGAGIYVRDGIHTDGIAVLFTTDPMRPTAIASNTATGLGGAFAAQSSTLHSTKASICLFNVNANNNQAAGAAIGEVDHASLYINTDPEGVCNKASLPALGAHACAAGIMCSVFSNNTGGYLGLFNVGVSHLAADRLTLRNNTASFAFNAYKAINPRLSNCLLAQNHFFISTIAVVHGDVFHIDGCTMAGNTLDGNRFFDLGSDFDPPASVQLTRSILYGDVDDKTALITGQSTLLADYNILRDLTTVSSGSGNIDGDPQLVDAANGDYHLGFGSPGIDYAPANEGLDLDGHTRNVDLNDAPFPNVFGPRDVGAYEVQLSCAGNDTVFCDGFESLPKMGLVTSLGTDEGAP